MIILYFKNTSPKKKYKLLLCQHGGFRFSGQSYHMAFVPYWQDQRKCTPGSEGSQWNFCIRSKIVFWTGVANSTHFKPGIDRCRQIHRHCISLVWSCTSPKKKYKLLLCQHGGFRFSGQSYHLAFVPYWRDQRKSTPGLKDLSGTSVSEVRSYFRLVSQIVSILSLVLIAVDRFIATVFPLIAATLITRKVTATLLFAMWLVPLANCTPIFHIYAVSEIGQKTFCLYAGNSLGMKIGFTSGVIMHNFAPLINKFRSSCPVSVHRKNVAPTVKNNEL